MRIESITAHAFGPFKGKTLELGQWMTVIYGPNESGKSTWHAALYAALCGVRRGHGQRVEDRDFRDRHRPWDGSGWEVSGIVRLEDGRRVELYHDLDGRVDCRARDVDLDRDYTSEIINDGSPDASRWLGLDRRSFLSTACVRQADIQSVVDQAEALQEHLQRAAATAGTDSTAAAALARLETFQGENVGADRSNSTRPLRAAGRRSEQAQGQLKHAREAHQEYLQQLETVEQLQEELAAKQKALRLAEAARARLVSQQWRRKAERARELADKHPIEPCDPSELKRQAQAIRRALERWDNQPALIEVGPPTSIEVAKEIQELPPHPDGDTRPHNDVINAKTTFHTAHTNLVNHENRRPAEPEEILAGGLGSQEIRRLAEEVALEEPEIDPALEARVKKARAKLEAPATPGGQPERKAAPGFLRPLIILLKLLVAIVRSLFGGGKPHDDYAARARALEELGQADSELGDIKYKVKDIRRRREAAEATLNESRLPANAGTLTELARRIEEVAQQQSDLQRWQNEEQRLRKEYDRAVEALRQALESRGARADQSVAESLETYERECEEREQQAQRASRRAYLEQLCQSKRQQEAIAAEADRCRGEAKRGVEEAAQVASVCADTHVELANRLRHWLGEAERLTQEQEEAKHDWEELQGLLDGQTVADLQESSARRSQVAERLAQGLDPGAIVQMDLSDDAESLLAGLRQDATRAEAALAEKRGRLEQFAKNIPSVAEAEEELARADADASRVRTLDQTLTKTQEFLRVAQERVHRNVAPVLREALRPWLQAVTGGRYHDVRVFVDTLAVEVSGDGRSWRKANLLSRGTTEQIYLLLRVAMSRYLTTNGEPCPLVLDDVTVHCDPGRKSEILSLLHGISRNQQVILFSQEPETVGWAEGHLIAPEDKLVNLDPSEIPA